MLLLCERVATIASRWRGRGPGDAPESANLDVVASKANRRPPLKASGAPSDRPIPPAIPSRRRRPAGTIRAWSRRAVSAVTVVGTAAGSRARATGGARRKRRLRTWNHGMPEAPLNIGDLPMSRRWTAPRNPQSRQPFRRHSPSTTSGTARAQAIGRWCDELESLCSRCRETSTTCLADDCRRSPCRRLVAGLAH